MRGKSKSLPKYRKHRKSGQAVVTLHGRDFYLGRFGTKASEIEYDRRISEWLSSGRQLLDDEPVQDITVAEVILLYMKWARKHYRKNGEVTETYVSLKSSFRLLLRLYGKTPAGEFGPTKLKAVRQKMSEPAEVDFKTRRVTRRSFFRGLDQV